MSKTSKATALQHVVTIEKHALKHGLEPAELLAVLGIVLRGKLGFSLFLSLYALNFCSTFFLQPLKDDASARRLGKTLYPRTVVPDSAVVDILGVLNSKRAITLKVQLLKWLISVFGSLESKKTLSLCYGVLFHFLGYDSMR